MIYQTVISVRVFCILDWMSIWHSKINIQIYLKFWSQKFYFCRNKLHKYYNYIKSFYKTVQNKISNAFVKVSIIKYQIQNISNAFMKVSRIKILFRQLSLSNLEISTKVDFPPWIQMGKSNLWIPWGKYKGTSFLPLFPFQSQMKWFEERFPESFSSFRK